MSSSLLNVGRSVMLASNLMYSVGSFFADFNETHVYNPRWPGTQPLPPLAPPTPLTSTGHARFHNGQTMTLGVLLTVASAFFIFRPCDSKAAQRDSMRTAAIIGSMYCLAGLSAILYPGATWNDPPVPSGRPQLFLFSGLVVTNWVGYLVGVNGIGNIKRA